MGRTWNTLLGIGACLLPVCSEPPEGGLGPLMKFSLVSVAFAMTILEKKSDNKREIELMRIFEAMIEDTTRL